MLSRKQVCMHYPHYCLLQALDGDSEGPQRRAVPQLDDNMSFFEMLAAAKAAHSSN
jgi:hypothetical protein